MDILGHGDIGGDCDCLGFLDSGDVSSSDCSDEGEEGGKGGGE